MGRRSALRRTPSRSRWACSCVACNCLLSAHSYSQERDAGKSEGARGGIEGGFFSMLPPHLKAKADDWLTTSGAAKLFFASTFLVLALFPVFRGWIDPTKMSLLMRISWTTFGALGTCALLFLWFGMWTYWVRLDDSKTYSKRLWFLVLLLGFWYGSCVYCYFVYLPQVIRRSRLQRQ